MKGEERREKILKRLSVSTTPVSAGRLADEFGVSRQIIVQDIARLRATGAEISSLARGYILENKSFGGRVFKVIHSDEDVEKELNLIVDSGGVVEDVFIYHKFYGTVTAKMDIKTREDVKTFLDKISSGKSSLLKNVTSGYHYHTVTADNDDILNLIETKLNENGFLAPLQAYEPMNMNKN